MDGTKSPGGAAALQKRLDNTQQMRNTLTAASKNLELTIVIGGSGEIRGRD